MGVILIAGVLLFHVETSEASISSSFSADEIKAMRGNTILAKRGFRKSHHARAMIVETCFIVPQREHGKVVEKLKGWNPTRHRGLGILSHHKIGSSLKSVDAFQAFQLEPSRGKGLSLLNDIRELRRGRATVHLSRVEASSLVSAINAMEVDEYERSLGAKPVSEVWQQILFERMKQYQERGLKGEQGYSVHGGEVFQLEEFNKVLEIRPDLKQTHKGLIKQILYGGGKAEFYYETLKINGSLTVLLGAYRSEYQNGIWKMVDHQFYFSDKLYSSFIFYDLEPVEGGTRIWRKDVVISDPFAGNSGMERMATENVLLQEVKKSVRALKKDLG